MHKKLLVSCFLLLGTNAFAPPQDFWNAVVRWFPGSGFFQTKTLEYPLIVPFYAAQIYENSQLLRLVPAKSFDIVPLEMNRHCITSMAFSANGTTLAVGASDGAFGVWQISDDGQAWMHEATLEDLRHEISCLAISPDGKTIAIATADFAINLWMRDADSGSWVCKQILTEHKGRINTVAFAPQGGLMISAASDGTVKFWSRQWPTQLWSCSQRKFFDWSKFGFYWPIIHSARFSSNGEHIVIPSHFGNEVEIFTCQATYAKKMPWRIRLGADGAIDAAFAPCGTKLVVARHCFVEVWGLDDKNTWIQQRSFIGSAKINHVMFAPHGQTILSRYADGSVRIWSLETWRCLQTFNSADECWITTSTFSPDGKWLVMGLSNGDVKVYCVPNGSVRVNS